jgi:hypothetical protein
VYLGAPYAFFIKVLLTYQKKKMCFVFLKKGFVVCFENVLMAWKGSLYLFKADRIALIKSTLSNLPHI